MAALLGGLGGGGGSSREPVATLLAQFGLPLNDDTVKLAESMAEYAWAADVPGGQDAAKYLAGMRIVGLLFGQLSGGEDDPHMLLLISLLRSETVKSITDYVNSHQRTPKATLEAEVRQRMAVFVQQVMLIQEGIITWQGPAAGTGGITLPKAVGPGPSYPPPSGATRTPSSSGRATHQNPAAVKPSPAPEKPKPEKGGGLFDGIFGGGPKDVIDAGKQQQQQSTGRPKSQESTKRPGRQEPAPKAAEPKRAPVETKRPAAAVPKAASPVPKAASPPPPKPEPVIIQTPVKGLHPTVLPSTDFDADADVEALRKAMKGMGCDDKAVINVLAFRSIGQRQEICKRFKAKHGKDLPNQLEGELRGSMEDVALALVKTAYEYDAYLLRKAMKGLGTSEEVLVEILASRTSSHLQGVGQCFKQMYGKDLLKEMESETSGDFKSLLAGRFTVVRSDDGQVDLTAAQQDAQVLYAAGEGKRGTNEAAFIDIFSTRSNAQLNSMFQEYDKISKKSMEEAISSENSGDFEALLLAIAKCARDTQDYFAELLYVSMKGMGTNDDQLIRTVVSRCEVDMVEVKQCYQQRRGKSLEAAIESDCGGNYKRFLLALIGE